jgi:phage baseplate assembly protein gpV
MYNQIKFGTVVDINDPEKLGRVKVNVYGLHDNIETADLPWSMVMMPGNTPAKGGVGSSVNLLVGTLVAGMCMDRAMQEFMVMGSLPTKTEGVEDNNVRVRAEADPNADEEIGSYQPPSTYAPEYPYNNVMETESGHVKEYDDTPGVERITERHKSGTQYEIAANGSKTERIVRDNYRLVVGHDTLEVYGDVRIIVSGNADVAVAGNMNTAVAGNIDAVSTTGNITTTSTEGDITVTTTDTTKKITLAGNVDITENLTVAKNVTVTGTTTTSENLLLDSHKHGENNTPTNLTDGPQNG